MNPTVVPLSVTSPLTSPTPDAPDRDWQSLRDDALGALRESDWTDHNPSDPGVTMLEAGMLSVAEAHARTAMLDFAAAPVASAMWRDHVHPSGIDLPVDTPAVAALAAGLADHFQVIHDAIEAAQSRSEAVDAIVGLAEPSWTRPLAQAAVRVMRNRTFLQASLDLAGAVDAAVESAGPDHAVALLRLDPSFDHLWHAELHDLLELRRRRALIARARTLQTALATSTDRSETAALLEPVVAGIDDPGVDAAVAMMQCPEFPPEHFEADDGTTLVWPPTAIQSRTVEPVIGSDYVRLALGVVGVRRAWVHQGHQAGLRWDGEPSVASDHPGAVTILVEADDDAPAGNLALERNVLRALADPTDDPTATVPELAEVDHPFAQYRDDLTRATPRRMICDELAVSRLDVCEVEVRGAIHIAVGTVDDRGAVIAAALDRVDALLRDGRPEDREQAEPYECPRDLDGPWPLPEPAPSGWIPGQAMRFNEIIERLADDPVILGVSDVSLRLVDGQWYQPRPDEIAEFPLSANCVPELASAHCVTVAFVLEERS